MPRAARPRSLEVQVRPIPVEAIDVAERNPRRSLPDVDDLAASLSAYGLLQPLVVRPRRDRFVLIAGHRRFAAAQRLGWQTVPAVVRRTAPNEAYVGDTRQRGARAPPAAQLRAPERADRWRPPRPAGAHRRPDAPAR